MTKLQCTACNGTLALDIRKEFATCEFCGTKYDKRVMRQMIEGGQGYDNLVKNAEVFLMLGEFERAHEIFTEITNKHPDRARGWWGLFESETGGLTVFNKPDSVHVYHERALKFATDEERAEITSLYENYIKNQEVMNFKTAEHNRLMAERIFLIAKVNNKGSVVARILLVFFAVSIVFAAIEASSYIFAIIVAVAAIVGFICISNANASRRKRIIEIEKRLEELRK